MFQPTIPIVVCNAAAHIGFRHTHERGNKVAVTVTETNISGIAESVNEIVPPVVVPVATSPRETGRQGRRGEEGKGAIAVVAVNDPGTRIPAHGEIRIPIPVAIAPTAVSGRTEVRDMRTHGDLGEQLLRERCTGTDQGAAEDPANGGFHRYSSVCIHLFLRKMAERITEKMRFRVMCSIADGWIPS